MVLAHWIRFLLLPSPQAPPHMLVATRLAHPLLDPFGSLLNALDPGFAAMDPVRHLPGAVTAGSREAVAGMDSPGLGLKATVLWPEIDVSNVLTAGAAARLRASGRSSHLFTSSGPPMHASDHSLTSHIATAATAGVRAASAIGSCDQLPSTSVPARTCVSPSALQTAQAGAIKARLSSVRPHADAQHPPPQQQQQRSTDAAHAAPVTALVATSRDTHAPHATGVPPVQQSGRHEEGDENSLDARPNTRQDAPETTVSQGEVLGRKGSGRQRWQLPEPLQPSRLHQPHHTPPPGSAVLELQMPWEARVSGPATTTLSWQMRQADAEAASEDGPLPHFAGLQPAADGDVGGAGVWPPPALGEEQWGAAGPESPHSDRGTDSSVTAGQPGTAPQLEQAHAAYGQQQDQYPGPCLTRVIDFRPLISQAALHPVIQEADGGGESRAPVQRSLGSLSFATANSQEGRWLGSEHHHHSTEGLDATLVHGMVRRQRRGSSDRYSHVRHSQGSDGSGRELRTQQGGLLDPLRSSSDSSVNCVVHGDANGGQPEIDGDGEEVQEGWSGSGAGEHFLPHRSDHSDQQLLDHSAAHSAQSGLITGQASEGTHSGGSSNLLMPTPDFDSRSPDPRDRLQKQDCSSEVACGVGADQVQGPGPHTKDEDIAVQLMGRAVAEADRAMVGAMRQSAGVLVQSSTAALHELEGMMDRLTSLREQLIASRQQQQQQQA
ncbi:MAG: hypothetical protein WDW36_001433 [Sanguina aurantia]